MLWIGSGAMLVPLALLLWLQYQWLQDLERASTIARQETLENYLGVIAKEVKFEYITAAQNLLTLPAGILEPEYRHKISKFLRKRADEPLVKRLFIVNLLMPSRESIQYFDPESHQMFVPDWADESFPELATVQMAVAPWRVLRKKGGPVDDVAFIVEERDKDHRMVLKPMVGEDSRIVGLAGMILNEEHFRTEVLPTVLAGALPELRERENLRVSVRDGQGRWVVGRPIADLAPEHAPEPIHRHLAFVFRDWEVFLDGPSSTPQDWAKTNFAFNLSLTAMLSILVVGGLGLLLRATSREMHLSEMKNDFVSNVSHELRTPLASIRVFGELMRLGKIRDVDKVRQYGHYIEAESRRLTQLINNILDFSCIESGRKAYLFESVDLAEILHEMLDTWRIRLEHQGFVLHFEEPPDFPAVQADRDAVGQALFNLIDNAIKYSGDSKHIEVRLVCLDHEAVIEVADQGIGISRSEQKHIFDRFHRVGSGLAHDVKGSGLGLALVQYIASAHGGRVTVASQLGQGSTFSFHLPLDPGKAEPKFELQPSGKKGIGAQPVGAERVGAERISPGSV